MRKMTLATLLSIGLLAGCTNNMGAGQTGGAVIGGLAGGILGNQIGGGEGRTIATGVGVLIGALAGSAIGAQLDANDRAQMGQAFNQSTQVPIGERVEWDNPNSGNSGYYVPTRQGRTSNGRICRQYEQTIYIGGQAERGTGTACQNSDGSWEIQN